MRILFGGEGSPWSQMGGVGVAQPASSNSSGGSAARATLARAPSPYPHASPLPPPASHHAGRPPTPEPEQIRGGQTGRRRCVRSHRCTREAASPTAMQWRGAKVHARGWRADPREGQRVWAGERASGRRAMVRVHLRSWVGGKKSPDAEVKPRGSAEGEGAGERSTVRVGGDRSGLRDERSALRDER